MTTNSLFTPTLSDRKPSAGPPPWRLESLYLLAFFGGGAAAALVSAENARRLGLDRQTRLQLILLGIGFILLSGTLFGSLIGFASGIEDPERIAYWHKLIARNQLLTPLASVGFAWLLVRRQLRADRLYQIDHAGDDEYSSMWRIGFLSWFVTLLATCTVVALVALGWRAAA